MDARLPTNSLLPDEAIRLAHTLVAKAAEASGARALVIKGVVASAHGLRADRTPADVDLLVEPGGLTTFTQKLQEWGWHDRYGGYGDFPATSHSVTLLHDGWPCDIDAHRHYPGFLAPAQQVFDALWERRQILTVADRLVPMADWASSVAIMALHSARSTPDNPRHTDELRCLIDASTSWTMQQRGSLVALARKTGCVQSLDVFWNLIGVATHNAAESVAADDLAEWIRTLDGRVPGTRVWLRYLRDGGWSQAPMRVRTMLWLPESLMRASYAVGEGRAALLRARLVRLAEALGRVPRNLLAVVHGGHNVTRDALESAPRPDGGS